MNRKLAVAALSVGVMFLAGCNQDAKEKEAAKSEAAVVVAPVAQQTPPSNDTRAWKEYLVTAAKQNMDGIRSSPFMYYLPSAESEDFEEQYERQLDNVAGAMMRGVLPGNMLAFGSPESSRMADLIVDAFKTVPEGSMRDVRVLFIGKTDDLERVKTAVEPSSANVVFYEVK